jgi:AsmA protein
MKRFLFNPFTLVLVLAIFLFGIWLILVPAQIAGKIKQAIELRTGRELIVSGGSSLMFSPALGVALHDVSLTGASAMAEPVLRAKNLMVPLSLVQLIAGQGSTDSLVLEGAQINVILNAQGHANVLIEQTPDAGKTDADAQPGQPLHVKIIDGTFHFSDLRNGNEFELHQLSADVDYGEALTAAGSATVKNQRIHFSSTLNSLSRAFAEGSPLDLTVDGAGGSFSFSGRVATGGNLNLAGQALLESTDAPRLFNWLGVKLQGFGALKKISLSGALDAQGNVFLLKQAKLKVANMNAEGEVSFSNAGERPNLTAALGFNVLDFNLYQPAQAATTRGWSEKPINIADINAVDAQFKISANKMLYGTLVTGPATVEGSLKDRALSATIKSDAVAGGTALLDVSFDAQQLPPKLKLDVALTAVEGKSFLPAIIGQHWLSGPLTVAANLSASGESQAAMISSLAGDVDAKIEGGSIRGLDFAQNANAQAKLTLADGVATLGENSFAGTGEVDILRQALALSIAGRLIKGPWDAPVISPIETPLQ